MGRSVRLARAAESGDAEVKNVLPADPAQYQNRKPIEAYASKYSLKMPERQKASRTGELTGRRTGSSVEYQDRKDYTLGDDVRYIDWRAYARNDRLTIKLFREEISPTVDIFADTSSSMTVTPEKAMRCLDLSYLFFLLGQKLHGVTRIYSVSRQFLQLDNPLDLLHVQSEQESDPVPLLRSCPPLRRGGVKIFISDFLFPFSPAQLVGAFGAADRLILVQLLSAFEDNPDEHGAIRLEEAETADFLDVRLDKVTVAGYRKRLLNLREELDARTRTVQGAFVTLTDELSFDETLHRLLQESVVEV